MPSRFMFMELCGEVDEVGGARLFLAVEENAGSGGRNKFGGGGRNEVRDGGRAGPARCAGEDFGSPEARRTLDIRVCPLQLISKAEKVRLVFD